MRPLHVINLDTRDNHEEAVAAAAVTCKLAHMLEASSDLETSAGAPHARTHTHTHTHTNETPNPKPQPLPQCIKPNLKSMEPTPCALHPMPHALQSSAKTPQHS